MEQPIYQYGKTETDALSAADPVLGAAIERIGPIERAVMPDLFEALINAIAGQQISSKALATVWARLCDAVGSVTPNNLLAIGEERLRACGLSGRKVQYMRSVAQAVASGALDIHSLVDKNDEEVIRTLTALPGVGQWTAEMLLIFSLQRPNVLAYDDLGIRRGMCRLYGMDTLKKAQFDVYYARYTPYATVAGLYLWAVAAEP